MESVKKKKKLVMPSALVLLVFIIVVSAIATYFVPAGVFNRVIDSEGREVVDPTSFHYVEQNPVGLFELFLSIPIGIQECGNIISFLLIIGGAFRIMQKTGAVDVGMGTMVKKMSGRETLIIPVIMFIFSLGGAFLANAEEVLAFIPLVVTICVAMGFDSITGTAMLLLGAGAGFSSGITNAFTVGVAQGIAGLPLFSGIELRFVVYAVLTLVTIAYVYSYAKKIKKNPKLSSMYEEDRNMAININLNNLPEFTTRHKLVLLSFAASVVAIVFGVIKFNFYIDELSGVFLILSLVAGILGGLKAEEIADEFIKGAGDLLYAGIIIGFSRATTIVLTNANIMDTIINAMAGVLDGLPSIVSAVGMFVVQSLFNILVPSGSGSAAVTMPIMAPLGDMIGVTRQTTVLAYQFGDAFMNVISPTTGFFMAALAMNKISWNKWVKWFLPLFVVWCLIAAVFLIIAVQIGYGPF
jgi:uncharacterized ion transporter superfamily protein YfcC